MGECQTFITCALSFTLSPGDKPLRPAKGRGTVVEALASCISSLLTEDFQTLSLIFLFGFSGQRKPRVWQYHPNTLCLDLLAYSSAAVSSVSSGQVVTPPWYWVLVACQTVSRNPYNGPWSRHYFYHHFTGEEREDKSLGQVTHPLTKLGDKGHVPHQGLLAPESMPLFWKIRLTLHHPHERPVLMTVFPNWRKSEEDFQSYKKREEAEVASGIGFAAAVGDASPPATIAAARTTPPPSSFPRGHTQCSVQSLRALHSVRERLRFISIYLMRLLVRCVRR